MTSMTTITGITSNSCQKSCKFNYKLLNKILIIRELIFLNLKKWLFISHWFIRTLRFTTLTNWTSFRILTLEITH